MQPTQPCRHGTYLLLRERYYAPYLIKDLLRDGPLASIALRVSNFSLNFWRDDNYFRFLSMFKLMCSRLFLTSLSRQQLIISCLVRYPTLRHSEAFSITYKVAYGLAPVLFDPCGVFDGGTE